MMKNIKLYILLLGLSFALISHEFRNEDLNTTPIIKNMKLRITIGEDILMATLYDNPTTRDWISTLPVTTALEDHAGNEKIYYPERKLNKDGSPEGYKPSKGDITYYSPWGDIAIFYKDFGYASGLISLGKIDGNGIETLKNIGNKEVTFELVK